MSNLNLNKVVLAGRITSDIELKQTPSGKSVVSFNIAINRRFSKEGEQQADFVTIVAWNNVAEVLSKYFGKGSPLCVIGSIQTRTWTDTQGNKRYATEVKAEEIYFVDSKNQSIGGSINSSTGFSQPMANEQQKLNFASQSAPQQSDTTDDDDLPF